VRIVTTLMTILESVGVFAVGLLLRLALFVVVVAAVATPILLAVMGVKTVQDLWRRLLGLGELAGLPWRSGLLHSSGHLWLKPEGEALRVGLDGLAQRLIPGVQRVALPKEGASVRRGETVAEVVTAQGRVPISAPLDGTVTRVNKRLQQHPVRVERDPYLRGWLFAIRPQAAETGSFLKGAFARDWFRAERARLDRIFEQELGLAAADGGEPIVPPERALTHEQWERLAAAFLKAA
jgi:glycine cleavage system H lipoate-binding protein